MGKCYAVHDSVALGSTDIRTLLEVRYSMCLAHGVLQPVRELPFRCGVRFFLAGIEVLVVCSLYLGFQPVTEPPSHDDDLECLSAIRGYVLFRLVRLALHLGAIGYSGMCLFICDALCWFNMHLRHTVDLLFVRLRELGAQETLQALPSLEEDAYACFEPLGFFGISYLLVGLCHFFGAHAGYVFDCFVPSGIYGVETLLVGTYLRGVHVRHVFDRFVPSGIFGFYSVPSGIYGIEALFVGTYLRGLVGRRHARGP